MPYRHDYEYDLTHPEVLFSDKQHFNNVRESVCFRVVNRGGLWYDTLTAQEKYELLQWYIAWLDAWETQVVPETPTWLK